MAGGASEDAPGRAGTSVKLSVICHKWKVIL